MFDAIIRQAAERFGLGDNAKSFVGQLLALIFNPGSGGISGFLQKFKDAGLGNIAAGWVDGTPGDNDLQPDQLHAVLGSDTINALASKVGVPASAVSMAAAGLLPKLIGALTPGGRIPGGIPAEISGLIPGLGGLGVIGAKAMGAGDKIGNAARGAADNIAYGASAATGRTAASVDAGVDRAASGGLGWLKWLIPLIIVLALGYCMWNKRAQAPVAETTPAVDTAATDVAPADSAAMDTMPADDGMAADANAAAAVTPAAINPDAALDALQAGNFTADDLVKALNLTGIQFDTGSSRISSASDDILDKAAEVLKKAPAGTRVEIGGHTDNTGNAGTNQRLSEARANAVQARLVELGVSDAMLDAKGYGDTKPVADNGDDDGRAKNRRMEFSVAK